MPQSIIGLALGQPPDAGVVDGVRPDRAQRRDLPVERRRRSARHQRRGARASQSPAIFLARGAADERAHQRRLARPRVARSRSRLGIVLSRMKSGGTTPSEASWRKRSVSVGRGCGRTARAGRDKRPHPGGRGSGAGCRGSRARRNRRRRAGSAHRAPGGRRRCHRRSARPWRSRPSETRQCRSRARRPRSIRRARTPADADAARPPWRDPPALPRATRRRASREEGKVAGVEPEIGGEGGLSIRSSRTRRRAGRRAPGRDRWRRGQLARPGAARPARGR